ncbi:Catechol 2,3-dioxygenase-like lactoylglutathione lyase family enzyme [Stackebrandtia soli]
MVGLTGIHHVSLSVSDVDESVAWYGRVFGATVAMRRQGGGLDKAMLAVPGVDVALILVGHGDQAVPGSFNERRSGLDHLAFAVDDADLEAWVGRLDELGVAHDGIGSGSSGRLVAFRDPDDIAVELYTKR